MTDGIKKAEGDDAVNHPPHYKQHPSGIECIEITRHMNFNCGNAVKYIWRAGLKNDGVTQTMTPGTARTLQSFDRVKHIEDLKKARWYLADEIRRLGGEP